MRFGPESKLAGKTIEEIKDLIKAAGGIFPASRILSVSHSTIYNRLNVAGITLDDIMMEYQREIAPAIIDNDKLTGDYIISADYHSPFISMLWLNRLLNVAKKENIKQLVIGGDFGDIDRLSWWLRQKQAEDIAVKLDDELAFTEMVLEKLFEWFERIDIIGGNHWLRLLGAVTFSVSAKRLMGLVGQKDNPKLHFHGLFNWLLIDSKVRVTHPAKARKLDYTLARDLSILHPDQWIVVTHRHRASEAFTPDGRPIMEIGWMGDVERMRYIRYTDSTYYNWVNSFGVYKDGVMRNLTEYNYSWDDK